MEAAIVAAERGHKVTLFERSDSLGGQLKYADYVSFKSDLKDFKDYLVRRVYNLNIKVLIGMEATPEMLMKGNPDAVIAAVGADSIIPNIPGIDNPSVILATDTVENIERIGQKVAVIGGGQTGCEIGLHLAYESKEVVIVEMLDNVAPNAGFTYRNPLIEQLDKNLKYLTSVRCTKFSDHEIEIVDKNGKKQVIVADTVIVAAGMKPKVIESELFRDIAPDFFPIGDCDQAKDVKHAIRTGYDAGIQL
jgi:pyruvate/2-oxoglutarate dehydrogenase complex dihydrolipoamide dehydrogenase (E3) component